MKRLTLASLALAASLSSAFAMTVTLKGTLTVPPPSPGTPWADAFGLPNTPTTPTTAVQAYAFLQSLGINGNNSPASPTEAQTETMVKYLGARWYRGTLGPSADAGGDTYWNDVADNINAADASIKFKLDYFLNGNPSGGGGQAYTTTQIGDGSTSGTEIYNMVQLANAGKLRLIESFNEIDNFVTGWNGTTYGCINGCGAHYGTFNGIAQAQAYIYSKIEANSTLAGKYAFTTPSYVGGEYDNSGLQYGLSIPTGASGFISTGGIAVGTAFADVLNTHHYVNPSDASAHKNIKWDMASHISAPSPGDDYSNDFITTWAGSFTGNSTATIRDNPAVMTEGGDNGPPDRVAQAHAILLMLTENFFGGCLPGASTCTQGIKLTAPYTLLDCELNSCNGGGTPDVVSFGMFDYLNSYASFPVADYYHNLTTILYDTTAGFTPGNLNWNIASGCATGGISNLSVCHGGLLQRSDSHFFLLIMVDSDNTTQSPVVNFGHSFAHANVYDVSVGTAIQNSYNNISSLTMSFPTRGVQILELY